MKGSVDAWGSSLCNYIGVDIGRELIKQAAEDAANHIKDHTEYDKLIPCSKCHHKIFAIWPDGEKWYARCFKCDNSTKLKNSKIGALREWNDINRIRPER